MPAAILSKLHSLCFHPSDSCTCLLSCWYTWICTGIVCAASARFGSALIQMWCRMRGMLLPPCGGGGADAAPDAAKWAEDPTGPVGLMKPVPLTRPPPAEGGELLGSASKKRNANPSRAHVTTTPSTVHFRLRDRGRLRPVGRWAALMTDAPSLRLRSLLMRICVGQASGHPFETFLGTVQGATTGRCFMRTTLAFCGFQKRLPVSSLNLDIRQELAGNDREPPVESLAFRVLK